MSESDVNDLRGVVQKYIGTCMCGYLVMCLDTFSSGWSRSCVFNYKVDKMFIPEYECVKSRVRKLSARKGQWNTVTETALIFIFFPRVQFLIEVWSL
jgi:hypothetical protein